MMPLPYDDIILIRELYKDSQKKDNNIFKRLLHRITYHITLSTGLKRVLLSSVYKPGIITKKDFCCFANFVISTRSDILNDNVEVYFYNTKIIRRLYRYILMFPTINAEIDTYHSLNDDDMFYETHMVDGQSVREYVSNIDIESTLYYPIMIGALINYMEEPCKDD